MRVISHVVTRGLLSFPRLDLVDVVSSALAERCQRFAYY